MKQAIFYFDNNLFFMALNVIIKDKCATLSEEVYQEAKWLSECGYDNKSPYYPVWVGAVEKLFDKIKKGK